MRTVMVTGIAGRMAGLVAGVLAAQPHVRAVGIGRTIPDQPPPGVRVYACDMRGPALLDLFCAFTPDVVLHLDQPDEEQPAAPRDAGSRGNVFRAIEVLSAAAAARVGRVVLRSSSLVYGARPDAPAFLDETTPLTYAAHASLTQDYAETERVAADFARRTPEMEVVTLRLAPLVGRAVPSPLGRYLSQPTPRTLLGFDPRIQVIHPNDAAVAFALAALAPVVAGPINVAGSPPVPLGHAVRLAGRLPVPLPEPAFAIAALAREAPLPGIAAVASALATPAASLVGPVPFDTDFFRYACVADTRRAHTSLGWAPQHAAEDALRELYTPADAPE